MSQGISDAQFWRAWLQAGSQRNQSVGSSRENELSVRRLRRDTLQSHIPCHRHCHMLMRQTDHSCSSCLDRYLRRPGASSSNIRLCANDVHFTTDLSASSCTPPRDDYNKIASHLDDLCALPASIFRLHIPQPMSAQIAHACWPASPGTSLLSASATCTLALHPRRDPDHSRTAIACWPCDRRAAG